MHFSRPLLFLFALLPNYFLCQQVRAQGSLPSGWSQRDIGAVGVAGSASYANGVFTVSAAGPTIYGTSDGMHFVYQPLAGDGTILARVLSVQGMRSGTSAEVGVMIRETLNPNATHGYAAYRSAGPLVEFLWRPGTGWNTSFANSGSTPLAYWVKMVRSGNTFTASISPNGTSWTQVGVTQTIGMARRRERMKTTFITAIILIIVAGSSRVPTQPDPCKDVLEHFLKLDLSGTRLPPNGWRKTVQFFVRPTPAPPDIIDIVSDDFELHEAAATHDSARFTVYFPQFYGWLDSALHFKPTLQDTPGGPIIKKGGSVDYHLVLSDKLWEVQPDGQELKEVVSASDWRIESPRTLSVVSLAAATRYVSEVRDRSTDPVIKRNAGETLTKLTSLGSGTRLNR